jgi:hypothetical protein
MEQILAYQNVGAEELVIHWLDVDDIEGVRVLGEQVLPRVLN